jgi:hypothetical protein
MSGQANFFDQVTQYFNEAAKFTEYPAGLLEQIRVCNSVYRFRLPAPQGGRRDRGRSTRGASSTATTSCPSRAAFATAPMSTKKK